MQMQNSTATFDWVRIPRETTTQRQIEIHSSRSRHKVSKNTPAAVYAYIRALRSVGRTTVSVDEIAEALTLSAATVYAALRALRNRGVKLQRGF